VKLDATKSTHQPRSHFVQFARVVTGESVKKLSALARETENGAALVILVDGSFDQVFALGAIDQLDGAIVLESEAACGIGNRNGRVIGSTGNLEKKLMLLWLQTSDDRCIFAELEEPSEFKSKFCQRDE
jgi:hypothetical protein